MVLRSMPTRAITATAAQYEDRHLTRIYTENPIHFNSYEYDII